jgi:hypothetical protein
MKRFVLLAVLVAACSKSDAPAPAAKGAPTAAPATPAPATAVPAGERPKTVTDAQLAIVDKLISTFNDISEMMELAKTCDQKRSVLELATPEMAALAPEMARTVAEISADPAANAWFETTYKDRLGNAAGFLRNAASCKDDPGFMKALANLPMIKKKS